MRLNASKCKIIHFPAKKTETTPSIRISDTVLETVESYEYLGIDINTKIDPKQQWNKISSQISRNVYLLKQQLKKIGLDRKILVNVYKSLVLSKLRYSAVVLDSCTDQTKSEMQHLQNRMMRVIGLGSDWALNQHQIKPVSQ